MIFFGFFSKKSLKSIAIQKIISIFASRFVPIFSEKGTKRADIQPVYRLNIGRVLNIVPTRWNQFNY